jgi:hypothetical protein
MVITVLLNQIDRQHGAGTVRDDVGAVTREMERGHAPVAGAWPVPNLQLAD